jgi:AcrR family transcriptional regulator
VFDILSSAPPPAEPAGLRERKKQMAREAIVDAALELFARDGFEATTVSEIASLAGVSSATVARYFPSKESLLFPDRDARVAQARVAILARPREESPWRTLVSVFTGQPDALSSDDLRRLLLSRQAVARSSVLRGRAGWLLVEWRDMVADALVERDGLPIDVAHVLATVLMAIVDDGAARWAADDGREDLQSVLQRALAVVDPRRFD